MGHTSQLQFMIKCYILYLLNETKSHTPSINFMYYPIDENLLFHMLPNLFIINQIPLQSHSQPRSFVLWGSTFIIHTSTLDECLISSRK